MNKKELEFILQKGEGQYIEFKESCDKSLAKEIAAFANAMGGRIFLGVDNKNKVIGCKLTNNLKSRIINIAHNCDPKIEVSVSSFDNIVIIGVRESGNKLHRCSFGFYMRKGPNSQKMTRDEIMDFAVGEGKIRFDSQINNKFDFKKDFDDKLFSNYLERAGINEKIDKKSTLFNLGVLDHKGRLNNSGILFFSKNPKKYFINAYVTCARYIGHDKVDVLDRIDIESNVITQVEESIKFIRRNTRTGYKIKDIQREEIPEYPIEALREAIINAVMHRNYFEKGANVQVDIFDDRIEISNVGSLIPPLTKDNLGKIAVRRNPLIADLFHRIKFVEKMGTGIQRIRKECKRHGKVKFDIEINGYFVSIFRLTEPISEPITEPISEPITNNERRLVELIAKLSKPNIKVLEINISLSRTTIKRILSSLKERGLISYVGSRKRGFYVVKQLRGENE